LEFGNLGFSREGGKPECPEKNPRSKDEIEPTINSTHT